ncbi:MAG: RNA methyltransferase [Chlorobi bacterium]|nr:RNA methyltransferase [Chlorobiota bacterium]
MISKNKKKFLTSLQLKKYRILHNAFLAEGHKINHDLLNAGAVCKELYATTEWLKRNSDILPENFSDATDKELKSISNLKSAPEVIGVYEIKTVKPDVRKTGTSLILALDGIQDPGNLGTIIRTADWFGIKNIICSEDTADVYNPKVIQATMGAIARVNVSYTALESFIKNYKKETNMPVYGTFLEGENIYDKELSGKGVIVMGNEGKGIRKEIEKTVTDKLYIPNYPPEAETSESLNVATATAVICSEFRRRVLG